MNTSLTETPFWRSMVRLTRVGVSVGSVANPSWAVVPPAGLLYATVHKQRRRGRVVRVSTHLFYGRRQALQEAMAALPCSRHVNIAFVERYNGTDRHQNARKVRRSYRFSKDWDVHQVATYFSTYSYDFCWPVRTLRRQTPQGTWGSPRTPAMSAALTDHIWTLQEWITLPVIERSST